MMGCLTAPRRDAGYVHDDEWLHEHFGLRHGGANLPLLGRGMHGRVVATEHQTYGIPVAIKVQPRARLASGEERLLKFLREQKLRHAVQLIDVAKDARRRYVIMERGQPLAGRARQSGPPAYPATFAELQDFMRQVLGGLAELHRVGVYHRDVKLANLVRVRHAGGERIKLIDFGKSVAHPTPLMAPVYARADANGACSMYAELLAFHDPQAATAFRRWYRAQRHLRIADVQQHLFPTPLGQPATARWGCMAGWLRRQLVWRGHVTFEYLTSRVPMLAPQHLP
jgi:serine/threonine protein kinase